MIQRLRRGAPGARALTLTLALALSATACESSSEPTTERQEPEPGGEFSLFINEPENPLIPSNTTESEGAQVLEALFTNLVTYNAETSELEYEGVAESIESEDSKTWTITLNKGWTFHDGSSVSADSFIHAWNYAAHAGNAQGGSYFFSNIEGYDQLQKEDVAAGATLKGVRKLDENSFEVVLREPFRQFPLTLGYTAFAPLPAAFFGADGKPGGEDDSAGAESFGKKPIGNGPYQAASELVAGRGITLERFEDYAGKKGLAERVEIKIYSDINTAYTDVQAGNLDIAGDIPPETLETAPEEFGERYEERASSSFTYLGFPTYDKRFADPRVRRAFSMAIDRKAISDAIFNGTNTPAASAISPVVDGHRPDACSACKHDPKAAKALLDQTEFDTSQPVELWFNAGGGHDEWVQAVGNQLRDSLGIEYKLQGGLQFAEYLPKADSRGFTGPFRLGWGMDYPSPQNYLEPLYSSAALPPNGSNTAFYTNEKFDELVKAGNRAETNEEAIELYQQAEDLLLEDMPIAPMFFGKEQYVWSENVSNVTMDAFGHVRISQVSVNG